MLYLLVALEAVWGWEGTATTAILFFFHVLLFQQFRARGRGWGRGNFSGNNNSNSGGNNDFQKRTREEEWDPEYTPKSKKYYLVCVWSTETWISASDSSGLKCFSLMTAGAFTSNPPG